LQGDEYHEVGQALRDGRLDDLRVSDAESLLLDYVATLTRHAHRITDAQVYAVDANAYFARPGPRVAEGVELLAHLFHPDRFTWPHQHQPWAKIV